MLRFLAWATRKKDFMSSQMRETEWSRFGGGWEIRSSVLEVLLHGRCLLDIHVSGRLLNIQVWSSEEKLWSEQWYWKPSVLRSPGAKTWRSQRDKEEPTRDSQGEWSKTRRKPGTQVKTVRRSKWSPCKCCWEVKYGENRELAMGFKQRQRTPVPLKKGILAA